MPAFDPALDRLLGDVEAGALLVLDEHPLDRSHWQQLARSRARVLTSRYDQWLAARTAGVDATFSDYFVDSPCRDLPLILYRVSKEKAVVHHVINAAVERLASGGELLVAGHKNEGIRGYVDRATSRFGAPQSTGRGPAQLTLARFRRDASRDPGAALEDSGYPTMREIGRIGELPLQSKPGIYGWNKIDAGSEMLIDCVAASGALHGSVLDLGCGYGYLSMRAVTLGATHIVATDNCAAALAAARCNLEQIPGLEFDVVPGDAAAEVEGRFETILCNPPFHRGFRADRALTHSFLRGVASHLAVGGSCWMVVNRFIPVDRLAGEHGLSASPVSDADGFRVFRLRLV